MRNLWISIIPTLIICAILLVMCIVMTIKKSKDFILVDIIFIVGLCVFIPTVTLYVEDIKQKETASFIGQYVQYSKGGGNSLPGCSNNTFVDENGERDYLIVPSVIFSEYNLKKGNTYCITYYKNSHVVHSVMRCD